MIRNVKRIYNGTISRDGAGVKLNRIFGYYDKEQLDPFLLLDFFDSRNDEDYISGFPWHPHRGIETITYLIKGKIEHQDSLGNSGEINDGDCQWMTAGSGIIHQEMPKSSEHMFGTQLWLNLPKEHKMTKPVYRDARHDMIKSYNDDKMTVKVICGQFNGVQGVINGTFVEPVYLDVTIKTNGYFEMETESDKNVFILLLEGSLIFPRGYMAVASKERGILLEQGEKVFIESQAGARFLLIAGKSLHQPIAWGGPIVMNTREELELAFNELDHNTFIKD
ncbi:MAG: pirin family protein [Clostridia bacterium]|nr:pirin family protein [Clostridia bacterium]